MISSGNQPEAPPGPGAARPSPAGRSRSALSILFVTVFLDLVGFGVVIPLLPLYAEHFGASPLAVTWLVAVYSLMQFFFAPAWGRLSDRVGRRPVLLVGLFGSALSYLLFGFASSLTVLFVARALAGLMGANIGVAQAYVADVTAPEERARGMGMIGAAFGLGFIFGPALGGLLSHYGMTVPFYGAAALAFLNGLVAVVRLPEPLAERPRGPRAATGIRDRLRLLRSTSGPGALVYGAFFLLTFAFAGLEATFSLWADRRWRLGPAEVAYAFAYLGLLVTLVQGALIGPLVRRLGEWRLAMLGSVALGLGLALLPLAPSLGWMAGALALVAFGQGAAVPAISALVSRRAPAAAQGRLLGVSQSLSALGRVLGPVWGGLVFSRLGIGTPYLTGAAVVGAAALLLRATPPASS